MATAITKNCGTSDTGCSYARFSRANPLVTKPVPLSASRITVILKDTTPSLCCLKLRHPLNCRTLL